MLQRFSFADQAANQPRDGAPNRTRAYRTESLSINTGSLLAIRGAILTDLRHILDEVRDLIKAARQGE